MVVTSVARLHEGSLVIDVQVNEDVGMTPGELATEMEALFNTLRSSTPQSNVALHSEGRAVYCTVVFAAPARSKPLLAKATPVEEPAPESVKRPRKPRAKK